MNAPRGAERVLQSLGATREFSDEVLGDLAEEYVLRVRWDGERAARFWYYRECVRVAPYLFRDRWRRRSWLDVGDAVHAFLWSSVSLWVFEKLMHRAVHNFVVAAERTRWWAVMPAFMLAWTLADGLVGGYVAAWTSRRAKLVNSLVCGAVWGSVMIVSYAWLFPEIRRYGYGPSPAHFALNVATMLLGVALGAILRVARHDSHHDHDNSRTFALDD
ncbi:MAG TPA: hypothetical protein VN706_05095 [Gemmatimonadaceae bacterium]|nr:hypothetical protein [Gemmatimonadaceae bacterium]